MSEPQPNDSANIRDICHKIFLHAATLVGAQAAHGIVKRVLSRIFEVIQRKPTALLGLLLGQDPGEAIEAHIRRITEHTARDQYQTSRYQRSNRGNVHRPRSGEGQLDTRGRRDSCGVEKSRASKRLEGLRELMYRKAVFMRVEAPDDIVQVAWGKILNAIRHSPASFLAFAFQSDPKRAIEAYALAATRNVVRGWWKQTNRRGSMFRDLRQLIIQEPIQPSETKRLWDREEVKILIRRGLLSLCPQDRAPIQWFYFENKSHKEIRKKLKLESVNLVRVRMHRARGALATAIRAQQCLSCLDRQVLRMFVFEKRSLDQIRCALKFLSTETLRARLHTPNDPLAIAISFISRLQPLDRALFRYYYLDHFPVEYITQALDRPSVACMAHRLRRILADLVVAFES